MNEETVKLAEMLLDMSTSLLMGKIGEDVFLKNLEVVGQKYGEAEECFLSTDCSGHWYVVPVANKEEWEEWTNIDEDNPLGWEAPSYACAVGGCPGQIEFMYNIKKGE